MRLNKFIISTCMLLLASNAMAQDSTSIDSQESDAYKHYVEMRRRHWAQLIPNQIVVQNAGNMGLLSAGIGWRYGHQHWETHWLVGFIPKHQSTRPKLTMTLKENFIPWNLRLTEPQGASTDFMKRGWTLSPLTASIYLNTVYGHEFWKKQPSRYPEKYYQFMSTKFRFNLALGQRISWEIPSEKRKNAKSISLFYEVSSCDLYIRSKFQDSNISVKDILGLSLGVKLQTL